MHLYTQTGTLLCLSLYVCVRAFSSMYERFICQTVLESNTQHCHATYLIKYSIKTTLMQQHINVPRMANGTFMVFMLNSPFFQVQI